uniref:Thioredoxin domain-containing protein n=1 Tax=uncultured marine group II/III euryarchaeote KM3_155_G07 TaxID=1457898 RepID=A0A075GJY6_9EURY|nr:hypothetical protein [uncultured marine group II/III euryarchaeote KM3_155_G07]
MRSQALTLIAILTLLSTSLTGCISSTCVDSGDCEDDDGDDMVMDMVDDEPPDVWIGTPVPEFSGIDQHNRSWNASSFEGEVWVAYFSTPWCTHCETTLNAYDQAIPDGKFLIFNREFNDNYSNMTEWQETATERIGRNISRPFIHLPQFASDLNVYGIPQAFYVGGDGIILDYTLGARTDAGNLTAMFDEFSNPTA